ncbi:MAG: hypothetical protein ACIALR_05085 [Blastopirellula sp. JB062]
MSDSIFAPKSDWRRLASPRSLLAYLLILLVLFLFLAPQFSDNPAFLYLQTRLGEGADRPIDYLHVSPLSLTQTPDGTRVKYRLINDTPLDIAQVNLQFVFTPFPTDRPLSQIHIEQGIQSPVVSVNSVAPRSEITFETSANEYGPRDWMSWDAEVTSVDLQPGYWNDQLEPLVDLRLWKLGKGNGMFPEEISRIVPGEEKIINQQKAYSRLGKRPMLAQ